MNNQDFDNELRGVLFKNDRKTRENQPDYTGNMQVDGTEYWLSAWIKTPRSGGQKFMSLALTAKDAVGVEPVAASGTYDEDIPF